MTLRLIPRTDDPIDVTSSVCEELDWSLRISVGLQRLFVLHFALKAIGRNRRTKKMNKPNLQSGNQLSARAILMWRTAQILVWLAGLVILCYLIFDPTIGIHLFWNILIPVAPFLFVIAIGLWRNICPMASTALFSRHMGFSRRKRLSVKQSGKLRLIAVIALFLIVPLRHAIFNMAWQRLYWYCRWL